MLIDIEAKIRLSEYIGFDIDELLRDTDAVVFGGAVRDIIYNYHVLHNKVCKINDVDILCRSDASRKIYERLIDIGYVEYKPTYDTSLLYKECDKIINEPMTLVKIGKYIQLIVPSFSKYRLDNPNFDVMLNVLKNVDIQCCGVYYIGGTIQESISNAFFDCSKGYIVKCRMATMRTSRYQNRVRKLQASGWKYANELSPELELIINL